MRFPSAPPRTIMLFVPGSYTAECDSRFVNRSGSLTKGSGSDHVGTNCELWISWLGRDEACRDRGSIIRTRLGISCAAESAALPISVKLSSKIHVSEVLRLPETMVSYILLLKLSCF